MLNLSRKVGQSITIGDAIVHIREVRGNHISFAIDAPRTTEIYRTEIKDRPDKEKK